MDVYSFPAQTPCIMCVKYIGGIPRVYWGDIMSTSGGVQYIGDIMMHVGDIMNTSGDVQYIEEIS